MYIKLPLKIAFAVAGLAILMLAWPQMLYCQSNGVLASVQINAKVQENPPQIKLYWKGSDQASEWKISSKLKEERDWGTVEKTQPSSDTVYIDSTVEVGKSYEYQVVKIKNGKEIGEGYINSGIQVPAVEDRGQLLLLVKDTLTNDLDKEIRRLEMDMTGDGWEVLTRYVSDNETVNDVKQKIKDLHQAKEALKTVFLLGAIPVPYAGNIAPDGHRPQTTPNKPHLGAWPADLYYGELDGNWTDQKDFDSASIFARNVNKQGDDKFDQSRLDTLSSNNVTPVNSKIDLQIGRVDLSKMDQFQKNESELLKRYLDKNHRYRHAQINVNQQAVIEGNFNLKEGFPQNGWRNFSSMVGIEHLKEADYTASLKKDHYLWSFGTGAGTMTSAGGIANTNDFVTDSLQGVFTILFGSIFGDWDGTNNFLRAPLASKGPMLTSCWAGRPHWHMHHMAMGANIGYSTLLTQNNFFSDNNTPLYKTGSSSGLVHVALMGDPTLRMYMVGPPKNLASNTAEDKRSVNLSWTAANGNIKGYHLYRFNPFKESYERVNQAIIEGTTYEDEAPKMETQPYMVRAVKLQTTPSGSFYNLSQADFDTAQNVTPTSIDQAKARKVKIDVYPNPASDELNIELKSSALVESNVALMDISGKTVKELPQAFDAKGQLVINVEGLKRGFYLLKIEQKGFERIRKVMIK